MNIIDKLEKMDPLFKGIKVKILDHVEVFDHLNNRITIKQKKLYLNILIMMALFKQKKIQKEKSSI